MRVKNVADAKAASGPAFPANEAIALDSNRPFALRRDALHCSPLLSASAIRALVNPMKRPIIIAGLLLGIVLINLLFVAKYGVRVNAALGLAIAYAFLFAILTLAVRKLRSPIPAWIPVGLILLFCGLAFVALHRVNPTNVKVDRWSAMTNFDAALLRGDYPYLAKTHLDGVMSCLPIMYISGLPFYLLGDVGYYQIFSLLLFALLVYKMAAGNNTRTYVLLILMTSPVYVYEIIVRSDLFTNMVLLLVVIFVAEKWRYHKTAKRMLLAGILVGLVCLTRSISELLFLLYFLRYFDRRKEMALGASFVAGVVAAFVAVLAVFYVWNPTDFMAHIPFSHQKGFIPTGVLAIFVLLTVAAAIFAKDLNRFLWSAGFLMFALISSLFILTIHQVGMRNAVWGNMFDISYFSFAMPFAVLGVACALEDGYDKARVACVC
jgi:hypothetical protein